MNKLEITAHILWEYAKRTGREDFSYWQIQKWYEINYRALELPWIHPNTFQRKIRELAQAGILQRRSYKRVSIFEINMTALWAFLHSQVKEVLA
jgi:DNA-binding HxlR family transcriptional regulator